jgi:hypothetical protein
MQAVYLAPLAEMYMGAGQVDAGLAAAGDGSAAAKETGERCVFRTDT